MAEFTGASREFTVAFEADERRLFTLALAILRDPSEAEDAVQETGLLAWQAWGQRAGDASTRAWLTTICVRHCIRRRRNLLRRLFTTNDLNERLEAVASHVAAHGRFVDLDRAFAELSTRQRAVISLHYAYGYSLDECAELMRCSSGTVASHLSRALAKMRKELGDD